MAMSSMSMPMPASGTGDSSVPLSTSSSDMTTMMGMDSMAMVFFTSTSTPIWSSAFRPRTTGQYTGTCIFLILFAIIFRLLLAFRVNFFETMAAVKYRRSGSLLQPNLAQPKAISRPWIASEAVMLGALDVIIVGMSYLLMLAVMTMNVGYFLSILGGVFLGSVLCGRFLHSSAAH